MSTRGRTVRSLFVIFAAMVATVALATGCSSSKKSTPNPTTSSGGGGSSSGNAVTVENFSFSPAELTVPVGTKVTWTFKDSAQHNVKGDGGLKSENESSGGTYEFTFNTAGTYNYICSIHPNMKGSVKVQ